MPKRGESEIGDVSLDAGTAASGAVSTQAVLNFIDLAGSEKASIHDSGLNTSVPIGATVRNPSPFGSTHRSSSNNKMMDP